jgi:3-hydroxy acid dehydrogenase/malonic semialdehyde reductase
MSKIALITGATSGIGAACARLFAQEGYDLIITGRRTERLNQLATELKVANDINVLSLTFDISKRAAVTTQLDALPVDWKQVDVLINNAGLSQGLDPIQSGLFDDWETMIDTNLKGLLYVTKIVSNWMIANTNGHIINIGSIAAKEVYANGNVYCATKHAVDALSKGMRIDLLPYGIRVTAIHPGFAATEFSKVRFKGDEEKAAAVYEGFAPLLATDIAGAIWFAVSRPANVNISDMLIMPTAQATVANILKKK